MKKINLYEKTTNIIYEIVHIYGDNGEIEGYYETIEEAKKEALDTKERYFENDYFYIYEMIWDESEGKYVNQYDHNNGLLDAICVI